MAASLAAFLPGDNDSDAAIPPLVSRLDGLLRESDASFGAAVAGEARLLDSYLAYRRRPWERPGAAAGLGALDEAALCVFARCAAPGGAPPDAARRLGGAAVCGGRARELARRGVAGALDGDASLLGAALPRLGAATAARLAAAGAAAAAGGAAGADAAAYVADAGRRRRRAALLQPNLFLVGARRRLLLFARLRSVPAARRDGLRRPHRLAPPMDASLR